MNLEDSILKAQEVVVNALISGHEFRGLGPLGKCLTILIAGDANDNAKAIYGDKTARTNSDFVALLEACQKQFVMDMLGFEGKPHSPQQAVRNLAERVYDQYIEWAHMGAKAA